MKNKTRVFVYGTLKNGHPNHRLLCDDSTTFLGRDTIKGKMVNLGWFPGVVNGESEVKGEVYEITEETLYGLDILEGHPKFYERVKVPTKFKNAWVYMLPDSYAKENEVAGGLWNPTDEEKEVWESAA